MKLKIKINQNYMEKIETFDSVMNEWIQQEADGLLERDLTEDELEEVKEAVLGDTWMLIQDKIQEMIDFRELIERNGDAQTTFPHYKVIWKNENAYVKNFKIFFFTKSYEDAKKAIGHQNCITEFDQYQIIKVDKDSETTLETVGEGRGI
jgi:hypothetical protein